MYMAALFKLRRSEPSLLAYLQNTILPGFPCHCAGARWGVPGGDGVVQRHADALVCRVDGACLRLLCAYLCEPLCGSTGRDAAYPSLGHAFMQYHTTIASQGFAFDDLRQVMTMTSPPRSGDYLAGVGAATAQQRMAAVTCWPICRSSSFYKRL